MDLVAHALLDSTLQVGIALSVYSIAKSAVLIRLVTPASLATLLMLMGYVLLLLLLFVLLIARIVPL